MIKIGIIIPDRGDRPLMVKNLLRIIKNQTYQPFCVELVNFAPSNGLCDITKRYRIGYDNLRNKGLDVIAFMENDDFYTPDYLEIMVNKWIENGKPDLLGLNHTIYYHIKLKKYFTMYHDTRSSAMNTLIKPDLYFKWCVDHEAFTDLYLWMKSGLKGKIIELENEICLGIKHGIGLCGGKTHVDKLHRFVSNDMDLSYLKKITNDDKKGFEFLSTYFSK